MHPHDLSDGKNPVRSRHRTRTILQLLEYVEHTTRPTAGNLHTVSIEQLTDAESDRGS